VAKFSGSMFARFGHRRSEAIVIGEMRFEEIRSAQEQISPRHVEVKHLDLEVNFGICHASERSAKSYKIETLVMRRTKAKPKLPSAQEY